VIESPLRVGQASFSNRPVFAITQGDPAGIGPEIALKALAARANLAEFQPLLIAERAALEAVRSIVPEGIWDRLHFLEQIPLRKELARFEAGVVPVYDPVRRPRWVRPGLSGPEDAWGALAAIDAGLELALTGEVDALVTGPVSKASIARYVEPTFFGHTDYLARRCGLREYGRDYLMAFLAPDLKVALLTVHLPLREALSRITSELIEAALVCLARHAPGRIAVAGMDPHAGEGGLLGSDDAQIVAPGVDRARSRGIDVHGPESADSLFARARRGEFDWVLALYHDQGLIAVKTAHFGLATNWTMGLPFLRTSVDHGVAFGIAGRGIADAQPLGAVLDATRHLLMQRSRVVV
jgi:4-hydroxythreonine-4-phosphate dehydrogenase